MVRTTTDCNSRSTQSLRRDSPQPVCCVLAGSAVWYPYNRTSPASLRLLTRLVQATTSTSRCTTTHHLLIRFETFTSASRPHCLRRFPRNTIFAWVSKAPPFAHESLTLLSTSRQPTFSACVVPSELSSSASISTDRASLSLRCVRRNSRVLSLCLLASFGVAVPSGTPCSLVEPGHRLGLLSLCTPLLSQDNYGALTCAGQRDDYCVLVLHTIEAIRPMHGWDIDSDAIFRKAMSQAMGDK
jgi:hypothetical protein